MGNGHCASRRGVLAHWAPLVAIALSSCAGVSHRPVPPGADWGAQGIRYYQTSMYLLVYADGKGDLKHEILELPDSTKKMAAQPYSSLSSLEFEMTFKNGGFASATETADSSAVPAAIVSAVAKFLPSLLAADQVAAKEYVVPAPRLYKIVVQGGEVRFEGNPPEVPLTVTLGASPKKGA